jgi:uncharacterized protein (TIGR03435 family)
MRASFCLLFWMLAAWPVFGQNPPAGGLSFEVASVHPLPPHSAPSARGLEISGDRVHIGPMILVNLIATAYGVQNYQVKGPAWLTSLQEITLFDVDAKASGGTTRAAAQEMLRNLLAERFALSVEIGSTEADAFALRVAKDGPKLRQRDASAAVTEPAKDYKGIPLVQMGPMKIAPAADGSAHVESSGIPGLIFYFTNIRFYPTPVVDETGLTGEYDIRLDIPPMDLTDLHPGEAVQRSLDAVSIGLAKLGLRLEPRKTTLKAVIVKHVEKDPTAN